MNTEEQKPQQHIQDTFAVDTGGPKQRGRQEEDGQCRQRIIGKTIPEDAEEGDVPQEDGEGEQEGIDAQMAERKKA